MGIQRILECRCRCRFCGRCGVHRCDDGGVGVVVEPPLVASEGESAVCAGSGFFLKLNFVWTLPKSPWKNVLTRYGLNDWFIFGIATMSSGAPTAIGYSFANAGGADLVDGGSEFAGRGGDVLAELSDGARAAAGCGYDWEFGSKIDLAAGNSELGFDGGEDVFDYREGADAVAGGVLQRVQPYAVFEV